MGWLLQYTTRSLWMRSRVMKHGVRPNPVPVATLEGQPEWDLVQRIVASPHLSKSPRLISLLQYVSRMTIEGRSAELTESHIGINVFGRPEGYNCSEDNIVRSHARLLRQKLDAYFRDAAEDVILTIPKGGYVPVFEPRARQTKERRPKKLWIIFVTLAIFGAVVAIAFRQPKQPDAPSRLLWSRIFQPNRNTILVPADSGLVMYENLTRRPVHLAEYLSRQYLSAPMPSESDPRIKGLGARRYTSLADLNMMVELARLPEAASGHFRIRYARDLSMEDFKESNVVLSGAAEANPWLELFENRLNFKIEDDQARGVFQISNSMPAPGEPAAYAYDPQNSDQRAYAVVAFLTGETNALIIEGTTVAGTEAAADFVLNDSAASPILRRARLRDGSLGDFQVLLETKNIAGSAPQARVVASRFAQTGH